MVFRFLVVNPLLFLRKNRYFAQIHFNIKIFYFCYILIFEIKSWTIVLRGRADSASRSWNLPTCWCSSLLKGFTRFSFDMTRLRVLFNKILTNKFKRSQNYYSTRNGKKNRRETADFGVSGVYTTVSSQFHIDHTYGSHHTQREPWKSALKAAAPTF